MINRLINLEVQQFRAIQNANIDLNGITVVAGVNGCGKSTLSKLLYNTIKISHNYDTIIKQRLNQDLGELIYALYSILRDISLDNYHIETLDDKTENKINNRWGNRINRRALAIKSNEDIFDYRDRVFKYVEQIENYLQIQLNQYSQNKPINIQDYLLDENDNLKYSSRVNRILKLIYNTVYNEENEENDDVILSNKGIDFLFSSLKSKIDKAVQNASHRIDYRPINCFLEELSSAFSQNIDNIKFNLYELDSPIIDWTREMLNPTNLIQDCVYIDTPMAIGHQYSSDLYWDDLSDTLQQSKPIFNNNIIAEINSTIADSNIISGQVFYDDNVINNGFAYKRKDGHIFDLEECATGIKSFGIIQMLLQNRILSKNTLLIIDEPEAHLHPQWIVEYARIIVLLNKKLGVKFFITSHNPDMVSAIRYIAEKEGILSNINYYLAEESSINTYTYDYKSLGTDIDAIFESFNIALERINLYGTTE